MVDRRNVVGALIVETRGLNGEDEDFGPCCQPN